MFFIKGPFRRPKLESYNDLEQKNTKNAIPPETPERIAILLQALFYFVARPFAGPEIILLKLRYYIAALLLLN